MHVFKIELYGEKLEIPNNLCITLYFLLILLFAKLCEFLNYTAIILVYNFILLKYKMLWFLK